MYYPGQVIYDLEAKKPVQIKDIWDIKVYPKRHMHLIKGNGKFGYELATPATVEEAVELLRMGYIQPAPISPTHCWKCGNWLANHRDDVCPRDRNKE